MARSLKWIYFPDSMPLGVLNLKIVPIKPVARANLFVHRRDKIKSDGFSHVLFYEP